MNDIERLAELFGSKRALAKACGIDPAIITRAAKTCSPVPVRFNAGIREAVKYRILGMPEDEAAAFVDAVDACLQPAVCPTCGGPIEPDRVV
jgi:hypothetical protein